MTTTTNEAQTAFEFPKLNVELLRDVVTWAVKSHDAKEDPEAVDLGQFEGWGEWNQGRWVVGFEEDDKICQTAFCIAGQAVAQSGYMFHFNDHETAYTCAPAIYVGLDKKKRPQFRPDPSQEFPISDKAAELLGLTYGEREALFNGENPIEHVIDYALLFAEKRGVDLGLPGEIAERRRRDPDATWRLETYREYPELRPHSCGNDDCPHSGQPVTELAS